ncbi:uncharacterized protein LOC102716659 [Oryza brachyantha]|uniref:uncharacterized protein LOC102716659 n=1 Tax=Oryza brachyantha TaxID=4533 RepID=UPI001AD96F4A|nr:uncharacterized protein LOC102716659 [Oryza brachyantha]
MRTEMLIRMQASSEKGHSKAMKVAAAIDGVESVTLAGEGRNLLRVVGSGVDSNHLTSRLRRKVGHADIVELRTLHDYRGSAGAGATTSGRAGTGYCYSQLSSSGGRSGGGHYYSGSYSPYYHQQQPAAAQHPYDGYYPSPYATTVVQHEYYPTSSDDPSGCSIM